MPIIWLRPRLRKHPLSKKGLSDQGCDEVTARDGPLGLEPVIKQRQDLIVMGVRIPGIDGFEVFGQMLAKSPNVLMVLNTAYSCGKDGFLPWMAGGYKGNGVYRRGADDCSFFTGGRHAGGNLGEVLLKRAADLKLPIQVRDSMARNVPDLPEELKVTPSNCKAHSRRQFADLPSSFPEECRNVLEVFGDVYHNGAVARREGMSPKERPALHKAKSDLRRPVTERLSEMKVEPNFGLGYAGLSYWPRRRILGYSRPDPC